jgi:hypothetical protein
MAEIFLTAQSKRSKKIWNAKAFMINSKGRSNILNAIKPVLLSYGENKRKVKNGVGRL